MMWRRVFTALLFVLIARASFGHGLTIFASIENGALVGRVSYDDDDEAAEGVRIVAKGPSDESLGEAKTDEHGRFRLVPAAAIMHTLIADDGAGHRAEFKVDVTPDVLTPPRQNATPPDQDLAREVRLMREDLDAFKRRAQLRDIAGGIGYVVGVAGLFALIKARRPLPNGDAAR